MASPINDPIIDTFWLDRENVDKVIATIEQLIHEGNELAADFPIQVERKEPETPSA